MGWKAPSRISAGVPREVLIDNARALVTHHDRETREVTFNERFHAFARYWEFKPQACAPYRARTKGKDEHGVGYVKKNALAGRQFASWEALEAHLIAWMRDIADVRVHGTTGERPIDRFTRIEAASLQPLEGRPPYHQIRELRRKVHAEATIEIDTNQYSVPWRLIGTSVTVEISAGTVRVFQAGVEVARHEQASGPPPAGPRSRPSRRHRRKSRGCSSSGVAEQYRTGTAGIELLRPLTEYEAVIGGGW